MAAPDLEPTEPPAESPIESLTLDEVYGLLGDWRRRAVVQYLLEGPGSGTLSELAEHVAGIASGEPASAVTPDERRRTYVALYHQHVPKLADAGLVDFDGDAQVELADGAADLGAYLSPRSDAEDRRPVARLQAPATLLLVGVGFGAAGSYGLVQLGAGVAVAAVAVFAIVVAAASHGASVLPAAADRSGR